MGRGDEGWNWSELVKTSLTLPNRRTQERWLCWHRLVRRALARARFRAPDRAERLTVGA